MAMPPDFHKLTHGSGRIRLCLEPRRVGPDILATLTGGAGHIGAVSLARPGAKDSPAMEAYGHREGEIAAETALMLANGLNCNVAVACGIHYDHITAAEIALVQQLARELAQKFINSLNCV